MLNNINMVKYYQVNSLIHKMNPISKLLCTIFFFLMTLFTHTFINLCLLGILLMGVLCLSKIPRVYYQKIILNFKVLFLIIFIIAVIGNISIMETLSFILKFIYILLYLILLVMTTPPAEITYAFEKLLFPVSKIGLSPSKLACNLALLLNFIPIVRSKSSQITKTIASKGIDFYHSNFKGRWIVVKSMIGSMTFLSRKKLNHIETMMQLRNFDINSIRTNYRMNQWSIIDTIFMSIHAIIIAYIIVSEVYLCVI